ncbi:MAG TPA: MoxR family ATPase [Polyangiaceae bacterium]|nr:MoxR family ATPase [Polyangiaceae bacterium]
MSDTEQTRDEIAKFSRKLGELREEIGKMIVGHREVVDGVLTCLLAGSHVLLEGVPGLGKTMLVRTLAQVLGLDFSRIQFTPDLMPADIIGTVVLDENAQGGHVFEFRRGPIFAHVVLADEINRATPKTQSALLEAMQEHRVTVGRNTYTLDEPYLVLATQNPLEMEGTYPLPEAQLDRFFFKLNVPFPGRDELRRIIERTTSDHQVELKAVVTRAEILEMQALVRRVPVAQHVVDHAISVLEATHPKNKAATDLVKRFVRTGSSPRGLQAMLLAAKINALFGGRFAASADDVRAAAVSALRHRLLLSFEGEAEGITSDEVIADLLKKVEPAKGA